MFREIPLENFENIKKGLVTPFPIINAVLCGLQEGKIFYDEAGLDLIIHKAAFSLIIGKEEQNEHIVDFLIECQDLPEYFHVYDASEELIGACRDKNDDLNIRVRERMQLRYNADSVSARDLPASRQGYTVEKIGKDNFGAMSAFDLQLESKFWNGKEDFLSNGYGFCVFSAEGQPVSICYTACLAAGLAEIDVATRTEYRKMGLASAAIQAFIEYSLDNHIVAGWDCFIDNIASLNTAESLGFIETKSYRFLSIYNKSRKK